MGRLNRIAIAGTTFIAHVAGVTINLTSGRTVNKPACSTNFILACTDIAAGQCCYIPSTVFGEAQFLGLPTEGIPAYGIVYQDTVNYGCSGDSTDTGYGLNLCLGSGTGAEWLQPNPSTKREEKQCSPVTPDTLYISGRKFNIFGDVPEQTSLDMVEVFKNSNVTADIPESFLAHEII